MELTAEETADALKWAKSRKHGSGVASVKVSVARVLLATHAENERLRERTANLRTAIELHAYEWQRDPKSRSDHEELARPQWAHDALAADIETQEPKMTETQAETGPSDEELQAEYERVEEETLANRVALARANPKIWGSNSLGEMCRRAARRATYAAGYQAGRASLAGELAEMAQRATNAEVGEKDGCEIIDELRAELEAEKAAHAETLASAQRQLAQHRETIESAQSVVARFPVEHRIGTMTLDQCISSLLESHAALASRGAADAPLELDASPSAGRRRSERGDDLVAEVPGAATEAGGGFGGDGRAGSSGSAGDGSRLVQPTCASSDPPVPLPIILHCPECRTRHIDEGEFATKAHHTHSCQGCGLTWRPAVIPTVGVQFLPGFKNEEPTERYVPSVGERAVLVASPDRQDQDLVGEAGIVEPTGDPESERAHWTFIDATGVEHFIHRDATWRRVEERPFCPEAPPDSEIGQMHELEPQKNEDGEHFADVTPLEYRGRRTWHGKGGYTRSEVSVLGWRRARPQGDTEKRVPGCKCHWEAGDSPCPVHGEDEDARPVEPATDPIEALSKRVDDLETRQNGLCVQQAEAERDLDRRVDAGSKRLDKLELQGRVARRMLALAFDRVAALPVFTATIESIEREERAK